MEPSEARKAFTKLAYSKFKNLPLYLEWAPENSLGNKNISFQNENKKKIEEKDKSKEVSENEANNQIKIPEESKVNLQDSKAIQDTKENQQDFIEEPEPDTTLFVKNLNFETTEESFKQHFEQCGKVHYATIAKKKDKTDPKKILSLGYGFVRFMYKKSLEKALKTLQQSVLDGKSLELKRSERTFQNEVVHNVRKTQNKTKQTGTKILVRNVPFQATKAEIQELFQVFGEIKALRLPKKMTPGAEGHRGFAFVDFVTNSDAKVCFVEFIVS